MARHVGRPRKPTHGKKPGSISQKASPLTREALASALDCVIAMDHEGKITEFNAAAEKTFGYSRAEAIGEDLAELIISPSQREAHRRALAHYRATGEGPLLNKRIELTAMRADKMELPVELTVTRIGKKQPPHFVGFIRDISERQRVEKEILTRRQRALILHEINAAVTSSLDLQTVIAFLLEKVDSLLPYAVSTLRLLNKKTGVLEATACRNIDETEWKTIKWKPTGGLARIVLETGTPLIIGDARRDPRTRHPNLLVKYGLFSYLGLPLVSRGKTLGVMSFYTKEVHEFDDEEIEFLSTLAGQAATAIHNSQLYEQAKEQATALDRSNQRTAALHEINLAITSSLDLKTVLEFLLEKIDSLLPQAVTTVRLLNKETEELEPVACRNIDQKDKEAWKALKWKGTKSLAKVVIDTRQPLIVPNVYLDPRTREPEILKKYGLVSYLGVPLIVRGETLGLIAFYTKEEHQFNDEETEFLSTLAGQAAIAIHNSQLYEKAKHQAIALEASHDRTKILHEINIAITSSLDLKAILDLLLMRIESLLPYRVTTVRLLNKQTGVLEPVASRNIDISEWKAKKWTRGLGLSNAVLETRAPVVVANARVDSRTRYPERIVKYGLYSFLGLPLMVKGELLGVISFYTKEEHYFSTAEIEFLSALAGQAAIAIQNSQLYEKSKEQAIALRTSHERTAALHEINLAMTSSLDLQTMLNLLLEKIDLLLPYSVATVRLLDRETGILKPTACRNLDEREWKAGSGTGGVGLTKEVLESRAPVFIANARVDPRTKNPDTIVKYGLCSYLGFPLVVKDEILGVISFYTKEEHRFSTEEIEFLSALAGQAAIAIHNSQLYEKTEMQRIALQKSEERFRTIARATNDAVWDWNLITNAVWWNEGVRTLFGYSEAEVGPDANWWYDHIHPEDREEVVTGIHTLIHSGGQFWSDEYRYRRADDSFAHVFDRGYIMRDGNGNPVHMIGAMMDITERKVLQKKISEIREMEQQRIGQDLHDGLGQHLTGLACLAKGLEQKLTARSTPEVADAKLITGLINEAIAQTRNLARGLYPVEVQANGLMWALEELATQTARIFDISCVFECNEPVLIDINAVAIHLYHIAKGAIDNAVKHGKAAHIVIRLCAKDGKIILLVKDDGIGFPVNFWTEPNSGMGVHIMKYRAEMIGGSLVIRRGAEGGTVLSCVFPNPIPSEED